MDIVYVYIVALGVCIFLLLYLKLILKQKKAMQNEKSWKQSQREAKAVRNDEEIAPIAVTNVEHMLASEVVEMFKEEYDGMYFIVFFTFRDRSGETFYGSYTTYNENDLMSVNRVAYLIDDPRKYRVLGKSYRMLHLRASGRSHSPSLILSLVTYIIDKYFEEKRYEELAIILLWIPTICLTVMIFWRLFGGMFVI